VQFPSLIFRSKILFVNNRQLFRKYLTFLNVIDSMMINLFMVILCCSEKKKNF
jgi:hypothetical protein